MAQKKKKNAGKGPGNSGGQKPKNQQQDLTSPWISMRTGVRVIAVVSIVMAVLTAIQAYQLDKSLLESIFWGVVFGGLIWAVFYGYIWFNRFIRR